MRISIAQLYILQIIKDSPLSMDEFCKRVNSVKRDIFTMEGETSPDGLSKEKKEVFSISVSMIYHFFKIMRKNKLIAIEKANTLPPRIISITITDKGRQLLDDFLEFAGKGKGPHKKDTPALKDRTYQKDIDYDSIRESLELAVITDLLKKELEEVTESERARIQRFIDKIVKIIERNV